MALIANSQEFIILCAKRQIFVFNTKDQTHSAVQLPKIPRKKSEHNGNVDDEKNADDEKNENNQENNGAEHGQEEFGDINRVAVSPCNRLVAVTTNNDKFLSLYQLGTDGALNLVNSCQLARATSALRFSPDSKQLLIADKTGDCYSYDCQNAANGGEAKWILGHLSIVLDILMSSDSK